MASVRIPRILSLVGLALVVTGVTFKLNHLMGAETVFNAGAVVLVLGLLLWAVALMRARK
jgi:Flp pilus assembly protein protease CpaA